MGKPTFVALLSLIEAQLDQDPWLGYQTLLALIQLVKSEPTYQGYVPLLQSMHVSYASRIRPTLLNPLPITVYRQQPLSIRLDVGRLPSSQMNLLVNGQTHQPSQTSPELVFTIPHDGLEPLPIQVRVQDHVVLDVALTFTSPVEMDHLGI